MQTRTAVIAIAAATLIGAGGAIGLGQLLGNEAPASGNASLEARLSRLEADLARERAAREELLEIIGAGQTQMPLQALDNENSVVSASNEEQQALLTARANAANIPDALDVSQGDDQPLSPTQYRRQTLIAGGFAEDEANWVLDNESQVELEQLYSQHKLQREAMAENTVESRAWLQRQFRTNRLRAKLGDEYYQRYLEANGWPTAAEIQTVVKGSAADKSGLQQGDRITSYGGKKVFNMRDVSRLTLQGQEGENVLVEIDRDGTPIQITIPRGPVGVSSVNNRFGR